MISNLLENANKFTESGGFELRLTYTDTIAELKIEVLDTGEGIPDTLLGDIFEPFVTSAVSGKSSGIGLGLYITRSLVTRMGGRIWAENRPEGGSRFQVTLPLKTASGETPVAAGRSGAPVRVVRGQTDYRVMIVDDVSANALLLSEQLTTWGFSAETLTTGAALLARAREWQPHLILLDLYLPDIDGFTLARTLQQDGGLRDIPVIALTASTIPSDHERARALGCRAVLTKPINFDLLAGTIAMLFGLETVDASDPSLYSERQSRRSLQSLSHALRELPHAWLQQMYLAAATAVPEDARSRIAEIEDHYPTAAVTLRQWVDAYDLSQIADLIEQVMY